LFTLDMINT